jgi:hypothetical protein
MVTVKSIVTSINMGLNKKGFGLRYKMIAIVLDKKVDGGFFKNLITGLCILKVLRKENSIRISSMDLK